MYKKAIAVLLMVWAGGAVAATVAKAAKAAKPPRPPLLERLSCRTGPNDEQARLIVEAVKGRVMEFAFYSRLGTRVCSIHAHRGDSFTKWQDDDANAGNVAIKMLKGNAQLEYKPGHVLLKFADVERMAYCGMYGELNATVEVFTKKPECTLAGVFEGVGDKDADAADDKKRDAAVK
jgi:hypothetical protein